MKDWIATGIHHIQDILNDSDELVSFQELGSKVGRAAHRLFEYKAVLTAFNLPMRGNTTGSSFRRKTI